MGQAVKLRLVVEGLEMAGSMESVYLDAARGDLIYLSEDILSEVIAGTADEDLPDWEKEPVAQARRILEGETAEVYVLPSQYDLNEFEIMEAFCGTVAEEKDAVALYGTVGGRGTFGRFKDCLRRLGLEKRWYAYRQEAFKEKAK